MEIAYYSISLVISFAIVRWLTEKLKFHIRSENIWIHHWIIAALAMFPLLYFSIENPLIWGAFTGISLEGLRRKNWSIKR